MDKLYSQLQKKMDNRRAELENLLRDNRELEDQCGHLQEWLGDYSRRLIDSLLVTWCSLPHHAFASALGTKAGDQLCRE